MEMRRNLRAYRVICFYSYLSRSKYSTRLLKTEITPLFRLPDKRGYIKLVTMRNEMIEYRNMVFNVRKKINKKFIFKLIKRITKIIRQCTKCRKPSSLVFVQMRSYLVLKNQTFEYKRSWR